MMPSKPKLKCWHILDYGKVPAPPARTSEVDFMCLNCMHESVLPVVGRAIAQSQQGLIFDPGEYAMPERIQCRYCRKQFERETSGVE
jgi:hypothetical protein